MSNPADTVEFAVWSTPIADETDVELLSLTFNAVERKLEAVLQGSDGWVLAFFTDVEAFRMLDEGGLMQLWAASAEQPRPNPTTFRVRGHRWTQESEIVFHLGTNDGWST